MQNMPINNESGLMSIFSNFAYDSQSYNQSNYGNSDEFSRLMNANLEAISRERDESTFRAAAKRSIALENGFEENYPLAALPYINSNSELQQSKSNLDIRLINSEVMQIAKNLRESNNDMSNKTIRDTLNLIADLAKMPGGATGRDIISVVRNSFEKENELSSQDKKHLENLSAKITQNKDDFSKLTQLLHGDSPKASIDGLTQCLNLMQANSEITLSKEELNALTKALKLSPEATTTLKSFMKGNSDLTLKPNELDLVLTAAKQEVTEKEQAKNSIMTSLENAMQSVLKDAKMRSDMEDSASARESNKIFYTKLQIENTSTKKIQAVIEGEDPQNQIKNVKYSENADKLKDTAKQELPEEHINTKIINERLNSHNNSKQVEENKNMQESENILAQKQIDKKESNKQDLNSKQDTSSSQDNKPNQKFNLANTKSESAIAAPNPLASSAPNLVFTTVKAEPLAPYTQVQDLGKSILSANQNGVKTLELQLHPLELGVVTVLLQSKNGEINAMIRPEQVETANIINAQVDQIRRELEDQGVKVGKVEVQNKNENFADTGQNNSSWQDSHAHNDAKNMQEQSDNLERLRRIAKLSGINTGQNLPDNSLAQKVQNIDNKATISTSDQGLHLVA